MLRVLDLCCGGQSVGLALHDMYGEASVEYVTLDADHKAQAKFHLDIRCWDYAASYPPGYFDVVWGSPPCTEYSTAKSVGTRRLHEADSIAKKVLEIIAYFQPRYWFIENPARGMLKRREFMQPLAPWYHECTYCQYGTKFMKPTAIWTNRPGLLLKHCRMTPCEYKGTHGRHEACAQAGPREGYTISTKRHLAYTIPKPLLRELLGGLLDEQQPGGPVAHQPAVQAGEPDPEGAEGG